VNRLHKVLEDAGVTLATVATDVMGVSGREMHALIAGMADPQLLADLAKARLRTDEAAAAADGVDGPVP